MTTGIVDLDRGGRCEEGGRGLWGKGADGGQSHKKVKGGGGGGAHTRVLPLQWHHSCAAFLQTAPTSLSRKERNACTPVQNQARCTKLDKPIEDIKIINVDVD